MGGDGGEFPVSGGRGVERVRGQEAGRAASAPVVVAKGVDFLAKRIRQVAETHEIPIIENPPLARALHAAVEVDQEIPAEHYKAVAEVIGYVMRLKGKVAK